MAESSYLQTFDDFEDGDHSISLLNNSPMHGHGIPHQGNNQSFNSYPDTSFDSEGFGQKVADYRVELERVNSEHLQRETGPVTPTAMRYPSHDNNNHNSSSTRVNDDNSANASTPLSGRFISRQLQDLDGLINQRRLELSELKKANKQRLDATPAPSSGGTSRGGAGGSGGTSGVGGFEMVMSPAVVSLSRASYEELKETERTLQGKLKAEQLRAKQLEDTVADLEHQCAGHAERAKGAVGDRNRLEVANGQKDEQLMILNDECHFLRGQLQTKAARLQELEAAGLVASDSFHTFPSLVADTPASHSSQQATREQQQQQQQHELAEGEESVPATRYAQLERESDSQHWQQQHQEQITQVLEEWSKKVDGLEEARRILEEEKLDANNVAYQWQSEAMHFEREVAAREETVVQAQQQLTQWQEKLRETELQLVQVQQQHQQQLQQLQQQQQHQQQPSQSITTGVTAPHTPQSRQQQQQQGQDEANSDEHRLREENDNDNDFWTERENDDNAMQDDSFSAMKTPQSVATSAGAAASSQSPSTSAALSSSVAKRVLLTWDKTMVERSKAKMLRKMQLAKTKAGRSVSHTTYLIMLAFFQGTVWLLLLLSSYFYFYNFRTCSVDEVRVAH